MSEQGASIGDLSRTPDIVPMVTPEQTPKTWEEIIGETRGKLDLIQKKHRRQAEGFSLQVTNTNKQIEEFGDMGSLGGIEKQMAEARANELKTQAKELKGKRQVEFNEAVGAEKGRGVLTRWETYFRENSILQNKKAELETEVRQLQKGVEDGKKHAREAIDGLRKTIGYRSREEAPKLWAELDRELELEKKYSTSEPLNETRRKLSRTNRRLDEITPDELKEGAKPKSGGFNTEARALLYGKKGEENKGVVSQFVEIAKRTKEEPTVVAEIRGSEPMTVAEVNEPEPVVVPAEPASLVEDDQVKREEAKKLEKIRLEKKLISAVSDGSHNEHGKFTNEELLALVNDGIVDDFDLPPGSFMDKVNAWKIIKDPTRAPYFNTLLWARNTLLDLGITKDHPDLVRFKEWYDNNKDRVRHTTKRSTNNPTQTAQDLNVPVVVRPAQTNVEGKKLWVKIKESGNRFTKTVLKRFSKKRRTE